MYIGEGGFCLERGGVCITESEREVFYKEGVFVLERGVRVRDLSEA